MTEWKTVTLSDLGEIVGGATPATSRDDYYNGDIPWLTPKDLAGYSGRYISRGARNITQNGLNSCSARLLPKNTVLFSSRAPIGYIAIAENDICTNQGFKSIVPNAQVSPLFLYYLLMYYKNEIEAMGSGTTFKEVSGSTMRNIKVRIPVLLNIQQRIADVLDALDTKIELNWKINDNLAMLLQCVYQQQFGNTLGSVSTGQLAEICDYSRDKVAVSTLTPSTYYSTENMLTEKAGAVEASSLPTVAQTTKCAVGDVLISNIRPYFKKIVYCQSECGCSTDVLCFHPKTPDLSAYLFCTLYADCFFDFMVAGAKGTKMPRGDKQQIMTYLVNIPSRDELYKFNAVAIPVLSHMEGNRAENVRLSALRDTLLPKLMSGEIDVSAIQL